MKAMPFDMSTAHFAFTAISIIPRRVLYKKKEMRLLRNGNYTRNTFSGFINEKNSYRVRRFVRLQYY